MDIGESRAWPILVADILDRTLSLWHEHRPSISLVVFVLVLFSTFLFNRTKSKQNPRRSLSPGTEEKDAWLCSSSVAVDHTIRLRTVDSEQRAHGAGKNGPNKAAVARVVVGQKPLKEKRSRTTDYSAQDFHIQPLVFFASLTGTTSRLSEIVVDELNALFGLHPTIRPAQSHDLSYIDLDDYFISGPPKHDGEKHSTQGATGVKYFYILLIPSYDIDTILTNFLSHLDETHHDFRIDTAPLAGLLGYSVFGVGDREGWPTEAAGFCSLAIETDRWMAKLTGRKRAYPLGLGDVKSDVEQKVKQWVGGLCEELIGMSETGVLGEGVPGSGDAVESGDEDEQADAEEEFPISRRQKRQKTTQTIDLEDVGSNKTQSAKSGPLAVDFTTYSTLLSSPPKEMVPKTSPTHAALTKQGYTIVGSHSGVKICRWTKSALRGRGSCYKNSFYGIKSHLCMETTPSLSCSNKCVFCWRHGTNPVSTTWRWQVDDPQTIFDGAKQGHYKKIKMMRGVPGVRFDRFEEAMRIRHCALSLVGEPIFYPRINEFVDLLHAERISTFLVCNAQHPDHLRRLKRVTQLYVSIDAGNRESLRKIDRPLHRDFWERFITCLDVIRERRSWQRTVYRLTLVKGFNVEDEVEGYADLIQRGLPGFVEIKGVTYCGTSTSKGAGLTMGNVPFYEEVVEFVQALHAALVRRGLNYGIAAEHAHSCCVLLADERFLRKEDGRWCTLIDYDRFFDLLGAGAEFGPEDYCAPTPEWALWGNGGFDPADERVDRKGRPIEEGEKRKKPPKKVEVVDAEQKTCDTEVVSI